MNYWKKERYKRTILQNLTFSNLFLLIQIIMFIIMTLKGGSTNPGILVYYGARANAFIILLHEYWRFITPIFLHIGLEHFAMNSLFLWKSIRKYRWSWKIFSHLLIKWYYGKSCQFCF